jgi:hypothetical protein
VTPSGVHTFQLRAPSGHNPPPTSMPLSLGDATLYVTAMSFTASGRHLAVSTTDCPLQLFGSETLVPQAWLQGNVLLTQKLVAVDGHIDVITARPGSSRGCVEGADEFGTIVLSSRKAFCIVCLDRVKGGAEVGGWGIERRDRKRIKPVFVGDPPGGVARLLRYRGVALGLAWLSRDELLVVEGDRERAMRMLPAPLVLRNYGE